MYTPALEHPIFALFWIAHMTVLVALTMFLVAILLLPDDRRDRYLKVAAGIEAICTASALILLFVELCYLTEK